MSNPFLNSDPDPAESTAQPSESLRAGAGRAVIDLPAELFPTEGFSGVHDTLHARVLLLESGNRVAFVSIELTSLPEEVLAALQKIVGEMADIPPENVLVFVTHTFSAPHFKPAQFCKTPADTQRNNMLFRVIKAAVYQAASQALTKMQAARFGFKTGFCNVNVNRDVPTADGWWLGSNETGPSDKSVIVLRFENVQGDPIALLFSYGVQPSVMDEPPGADADRLVTSDMAGAASRFLERQYGGAVTALFCLGTAADQAPSLKGARFQYVDKDGHIQVEDIEEEGFIIAKMLGRRLGTEVLQVSEKIKCQALVGPLSVKKGLVRCPGQHIAPDLRMICPTKTYAFLPAEERQEPVEIVMLGNVALVGVRPELCCRTGLDIKEQSPFPETMVLTMVNGGAKYMPDRSAYDRITYEAMNSPFGRGSAELLCEKVAELLRG
jgi:neutral ceramidase